jgi:hypothetical protein
MVTISSTSIASAIKGISETDIEKSIEKGLEKSSAR